MKQGEEDNPQIIKPKIFVGRDFLNVTGKGDVCTELKQEKVPERGQRMGMAGNGGRAAEATQAHGTGAEEGCELWVVRSQAVRGWVKG